MALVGWRLQLNGVFYWSVLVAGIFFVHQQKLIARRQRELCFKAFLNNNWVGFTLFVGVILGIWL
jgi:4-hydroxybenzoate polyprenyltransferase